MMFPYPCSKCERPLRLDEGLQCSSCKKNLNTEAGMYESFDPELPEIAAPSETASASRNHLDPNIMPLDSMIPVHNRKRYNPNDQIIKIIQPNMQSWQEICKITDRNLDFTQETNTATHVMLSGYNHSVNIRDAFLKNESQWNIGVFQGPQKDNGPVNKTFLNNEYQWNIAQYQGCYKDNPLVYKALLNNESQWNIGQFHGSQQNDALVQCSDSSESVREGELSKDDISAIPGPSGFHGNQSEPNMLDEVSKSSCTSKIPKVVLRRIITCKICGEDTDKHTKIKSGKIIGKYYFCCVCGYETKKTPNTLQQHIRIHCSKNDCSLCLKEYTEGSLHVSPQRCQKCPTTFNCRTQFDEHLLEKHGRDFEKNCWECCSPVIAHHTRIEGKKLYFCCLCGYETNYINNIKHHNEVHRPKTLCKICREEFKETKKGFHDGNYSCLKCKKEFKCRTQLEDHYNDKISCVEYFSEYCRVCNETIKEHTTKSQERKYYKCCSCENMFKVKQELENHLYKHTSLKNFKCDKCCKRFKRRDTRNRHSNECIPLNYPCERCRARFPSQDSLHKHVLEKHG